MRSFKTAALRFAVGQFSFSRLFLVGLGSLLNFCRNYDLMRSNRWKRMNTPMVSILCVYETVVITNNCCCCCRPGLKASIKYIRFGGKSYPETQIVTDYHKWFAYRSRSSMNFSDIFENHHWIYFEKFTIWTVGPIPFNRRTEQKKFSWNIFQSKSYA